MATRSKAQSKTNKVTKIPEYIPINKIDHSVESKFVQFLDIPAIESLYQKVNLIDLGQLSDKDFYYVKGCLDTLYALIGVATPLKRVIDKPLDEFADDRLQTYISSITASLNVSRSLREQTKEQIEIDPLRNSQEQLLQHIFNALEEAHEEGHETEP